MRYDSKKHFVEDIEGAYHALHVLLDELDDHEYLIAGVCADWSIKDMLAHLSEWHRLALTWYKTGLNDEKPEMPISGYKWNQIKELNRVFYERNRDKSLADVKSRFTRSHNQIMKLIETLSGEQLLKPGYYEWTTKYPLTTYFHPNTSGHYRWAIKHIKRWKKDRKH